MLCWRSLLIGWAFAGPVVADKVRNKLWMVLLAVWGVALLASCSSRPPRIPPPQISPDEAGMAAISAYDTDGDRVLSGGELEQCPGLRASLSRYDQDGDGSLNAEEIAARLRMWQESRMGMMPITCVVLLDGRPLDGALVRLVPEPFLGDAVKTATGTTNRRGIALVGVAQSDFDQDLGGLTGAQPGIYRIELTHPTQPLPAIYNTATEFGLEVAQDNAQLLDLVFRLSSRST